MQERLFRKVALDRLSSPDQLDAMLQITQPRAWLILATVAVILVSLGIWSVTARIPTTVQGEGMLVANESGLAATLYLPIGDAQVLEPGMEVRLAPVTISHQEYGYLRGVVEAVERTPSDSRIAHQLSPNAAVVAVHIRLIPDEAAPSGYAWTLDSGPEVALIPETLVFALIVLDEKAPLALVFAD